MKISCFLSYRHRRLLLQKVEKATRPLLLLSLGNRVIRSGPTASPSHSSFTPQLAANASRHTESDDTIAIGVIWPKGAYLRIVATCTAWHVTDRRISSTTRAEWCRANWQATTRSDRADEGGSPRRALGDRPCIKRKTNSRKVNIWAANQSNRFRKDLVGPRR